jgi:hypothetical protein
MPFRFEFYIDSEKLNGVEIGFSTSRKWEEALDEARLVVPFSYLNRTPYKMYALLTIRIHQFETYVQIVPTATQEHYYLVYSDQVEPVGKYGYHKHTVSGIEYVAKLDAYIVSNLSKSRSIVNYAQSKFEVNTDTNYFGGTANQYNVKVFLPTLEEKVSATIKAQKTVTFSQVGLATKVDFSHADGYSTANAVIRTNATLISGTNPHILSGGDANWVFPKGRWYIEYGFTADGDEGQGWSAGFVWVYRFYVNAVEDGDLSIYDVLEELRSCVSKFGGLEDTVYYDTTRVFDIDPAYEDYLKSVQAPQMYLEKTSARKMLIYVLAFVNALPKLIYDDDLDVLTLETYNLSTGVFSKADVIGHSAVQNTSQIGTRNYQHISQSLANELNEPSVYTPSQSGWQQVRSENIQLTANDFVLKLPREYPLYMPSKFVVLIPKIEIENLDVSAITHTYNNVEIDLTSRFINTEEWKLKELTDNFPSIDVYPMWTTEFGLRKNMVSNLAWNVGDTEIKLSQVVGQVFQSNLVVNVIREAIYEWVMLLLPKPVLLPGSFLDRFQVDITMPSITEYKDWRFRLEYITDERLVIKQDKEDLSQISFYSEMQQNQEESLVNVLRQSRKGYGDLQRTGNIAFTFAKLHRSFNEFYEIGQTDSDGYTITQIDTQWFNEHAMAVYGVTRYHNRIQQATYVNQKYRPFDNFAKTVLNRHENYTDYLIALPPNDLDVLLQDQTTKIYSNDNTIKRIMEIALGGEVILDSGKTKASVALVRTDGMLEVYDESLELNTRYYISVPVTAKGIKGAFAFTLGFASNQVAGDGLVKKTVLAVDTWYNQAVRYTDEQGRFSRLGFVILRDIEYRDLETVYAKYPLLFETTANTDIIFQNDAYFWCGNALQEEPFQRPLVWNKDPLTNANLTYQLSVISYYVGLYIFGIDFYAKNFIVNNPESTIPTYLYRYSNGTRYEMFDDIYVKSGYDNSVLLDPDIFSIGTANIEFDTTDNWLKFIGISMTGYTSWAIGRPDEDGSIRLIIACNENLNGVQFKAQHIRPNVYEIGAKTPLLYWIDVSVDLTVQVDLQYVLGPSHQLDIDVELTNQVDLVHVVNYGYPIDMSIDLTVRTRLLYFEGESNPIEMMIAETISVDLLITPTYFQELALDVGLTSNTVLTHQWNMDLTLDISLTSLADLQHYYTLNFDLILDNSQITTVGLLHTWDMTLDMDNDLNIGITLAYDPTYYQELVLDVPLTISVGLTYEKFEPQVADPVFDIASKSVGTDEGGTFYSLIFRIRNVDESTVTIKRTPPLSGYIYPYLNMGSIASMGYTGYVEIGDYYTSPPTIYAVGESATQLASNVVSWNDW